MKHVFITGATGFAGSNLCAYLDPVLFDVRKLDLRQPLVSLENADAVIHLAGKAHDLKNTSSPEEYYAVNTALTKTIFDLFLLSEANCFIFVSSVKAVRDKVVGVLTEDTIAEPQTPYGKSKLAAEQYILSRSVPPGKRVYILRPCMMHGPGNRGNLNLLYKMVAKNLPWPLGSFNNKRSFLSIENLCFTIVEMLHQDNIAPGIYNVADTEPLSTNELISLIATESGLRPMILRIPRKLIRLLAAVGDVLHLPLNSERLEKLTENYVVSNEKLEKALKRPLPVSAAAGLKATMQAFVRKSNVPGR